jgi:hypothetical protein
MAMFKRFFGGPEKTGGAVPPRSSTPGSVALSRPVPSVTRCGARQRCNAAAGTAHILLWESGALFRHGALPATQLMPSRRISGLAGRIVGPRARMSLASATQARNV